MDLEEVTLAYSILDSTLSQEITVSAIELRFHQISLNLMSALSQQETARQITNLKLI